MSGLSSRNIRYTGGTAKLVGNKLVVVDVANVRPEPMTSRGLFGRRIERDRDVLTSVEYIDSLLLDIRTQIPCASVIAIADRVLQHRLQTPSDQSAFRERTRLPTSDSDFIYLMPPQSVRRESRKFWGRQVESHAPEFVEADELILSVAAASEGLIVSGDYFRDFKYRNLVEWLAASHYLPVRDTSQGSWLLCSKTKTMRLRGREREDHASMRTIAGIDPIHLTSLDFDYESDLLLRRHVFETVIPEFWASKGAGDQIFTVGDRSPLVFRPFSALRLPERAPKTRAREVLNPVEPVSEELATSSDALIPMQATDSATQAVQAAHVRRRLTKTLWASNSSSNLRYIDQIVRMIGQVFQGSDGNVVLRWVYPYGSIRIVGEVPQHVRRAIDVVLLQGLLRIEGEELVLDINTYATRQVELFDLHTFYAKQLTKVRERHMRPRIRRWAPPVPKRFIVQPKAEVEPAVEVDVAPLLGAEQVEFDRSAPPLPKRSIAQPKSDVKPAIEIDVAPLLGAEQVEFNVPEQHNISEFASVTRPERSSGVKRKWVRFALLVGLSTIALIVAITLWQIVSAANPTNENSVVRKSQDSTASQFIKESGATSTSNFFRHGSLLVRW